jgi:nitroreductase
VELDALLRRRTMTRSFTGRPPRAGLVERLGAALAAAPSAGNARGVRAIVLERASDRSAFWEATTTPEWRARSSRYPGLRQAPLVVVVFASPRPYLERYREPDKASSGLGTDEGAWPVPYWFVDAGMVVMNLLLVAADEGLGACFLGNFRGEARLSDRLGVPSGWRYIGAVLIGEAAGDDRPSRSALRGRPAPQMLMGQGRFPS